MWSESVSHTETGFVRTPDGQRLFYRRTGDGPVILLLHGWPETGHAWRRVMPTLAVAGYTVLAPDLRGSGDSDKPIGGYEAPGHVEDMRALTQALDLTQALALADAPLCVVGHGDGGAEVAVAYARAYPQEVAALALISALPGGETAWHIGFHRTPDLPETILTPHLTAYVRHFLRAWAHDPHVFSDADVQLYVDALAAPGALRASLATSRAASGLSVTGLAAVPLLLLIGESDPRLTMSQIESARQALPDVCLQTIPRGGHWLPEERPDAVAAALLSFLKDADVPGDR